MPDNPNERIPCPFFHCKHTAPYAVSTNTDTVNTCGNHIAVAVRTMGGKAYVERVMSHNVD